MISPDRIIYDLALNDVTQIGDAFWRRVPGGWIVTETYADPLQPPDSPALRLHPVFVPFHSEFNEQAAVDIQRKVEGPHVVIEQPATDGHPHIIIRPSRMNEEGRTTSDTPPTPAADNDEEDLLEF